MSGHHPWPPPRRASDVLIHTKTTVIDWDNTARIREAETKGDVVGHEFHGNQYTGGQGGPPVVPTPKGPLNRDAMDHLAQMMGMFGEPEMTSPERYEPDRFGSPKLKAGETEPRLRTDEQGHPILIDVTPRPPNTPIEKWGQIEDMAHELVRVPGSERPLPYVFRVMSQEEYAGAAKNGYIQSDQRMNLADEGTVASHRSTGSFYMAQGDNRIVRITVQPGDNWTVDKRDGYIKTHDRIPFSRVDMVSPVISFDRASNRGTIKWLGEFERKGDVAGHAFHGNQYVEGSAAAHIENARAALAAGRPVDEANVHVANALNAFEDQGQGLGDGHPHPAFSETHSAMKLLNGIRKEPQARFTSAYTSAESHLQNALDHLKPTEAEHAHYMVEGKLPRPGRPGSFMTATYGPYHSSDEALAAASRQGVSRPRLQFYPPGTLNH